MAFRSTFSPTFDCLVRAGNQGIAFGNSTLAAWVRFDNLSASYEIIEINDSGGQPFASAIILNGNQIEYTQRNAAGVGNIDFLGATIVSANVWYHVALTYDGTTLRGYLNGIANGTATGLTGARGNWADLQVGPTLGNLSDAVFYTTALTADEIQQLYRNRLPGVRAGLFAHLPTFPGATNRLIDYSGNANDFSNNGTPAAATVADPQVPWGDDGGVMLLLPDGGGTPAVGSGDTRFNASGAASVAAAESGTGLTVFNGASTPAVAVAESATGLTRFNASGATTAAVAAVGDGRTRFDGSGTPTVATSAAGLGATLFNGTSAASTGAGGEGLTRFNGLGVPSVSVASIGLGLTRFNGTSTATVSGGGGGGGSIQLGGSTANRRHSIVYGTRRRIR